MAVASALKRQIAIRAADAAAPLEAARQRLSDAMAAVAASPPAQLRAAIAVSVQVGQAYRDAAAAAVAPTARAANAHWMHKGERPGPAMTQRMRPPVAATSITALRDTSGALITDSAAMATIMVEHYARISAPPRTTLQAREAVLDAVRADLAQGLLRAIPPDLAALAEAPFAGAEVLSTIKAAAHDTSPGPDGLPLAYWDHPRWADLLAAVFNACFLCDLLPQDFLLGTITPILKPDSPDVTQGAAFRPITLLGCDYRILTACLARRFGTALQPVIGPEQSAFLPGRRIEDAVLFSSLLPHVARAQGATMVLASLDISKAYDTVCRTFLIATLAALGASDGMLRWVRLLLTDTWASTQVNGFESPRRQWHAGVRQGCPLAPILYLCVSQALTCWLRHQPGLGIMVAGHRHVSNHFADDAKLIMLLLNATDATLSQPLAVFDGASGQGINLIKSEGALLGMDPELPVASVSGIPIRPAMVSLGVVIANAPPTPLRRLTQHLTRSQLRPAPAAAPLPVPLLQRRAEARAEAAHVRLTRLVGLGLSEFGGCLAASTYVLSTALYHAEFNTAHPALDGLATDVARAVAPGIPLHHLTGPPSTGGFGLLPYQAHITARHAAIACRLAARLLEPAHQWPSWVQLADFLLRDLCPSLHPVQTLLAATLAPTADIGRGDLGLPDGVQLQCVPPGMLATLMTALQRVGPLTPVLPSLPTTPVILSSTSMDAVSLHHALRHLAWQPPAVNAAFPPRPLLPAAAVVPVKQLTLILNSAAATTKRSSHAAFITAAVGSPATPAHHTRLKATFAAVWRLPCANRLKAPLWRLAAGAVPGTRVHPWRCPCDLHSTPARPGPAHSFWDCPVALAVRTQLDAALPGVHLTRADVWLVHKPRPALLDPVWQVVCCAALEAMDFGRRMLWARRYAPGWPDPGPRGLQALRQAVLPDLVDAHVWPAIVAARAAAVQEVANRAAARFWLTMADFADAQVQVPVGFQHIQPAHPFLALTNGRLVARIPPDIQED
jgi:hypothetical protein